MKRKCSSSTWDSLLEARMDAAGRSLFSTARKVQHVYGLGDAQMLQLALLIADWYDPQQTGDYFQSTDLADQEWHEQPAEEGNQ